MPFPKSGGCAYVYETFADPVSFVVEWTRWFTYASAGALYALGFASNFIELVYLYRAGLPRLPGMGAQLRAWGCRDARHAQRPLHRGQRAGSA